MFELKFVRRVGMTQPDQVTWPPDLSPFSVSALLPHIMKFTVSLAYWCHSCWWLLLMSAVVGRGLSLYLLLLAVYLGGHWWKLVIFGPAWRGRLFLLAVGVCCRLCRCCMFLSVAVNFSCYLLSISAIDVGLTPLFLSAVVSCRLGRWKSTCCCLNIYFISWKIFLLQTSCHFFSQRHFLCRVIFQYSLAQCACFLKIVSLR